MFRVWVVDLFLRGRGLVLPRKRKGRRKRQTYARRDLCRFISRSAFAACSVAVRCIVMSRSWS